MSKSKISSVLISDQLDQLASQSDDVFQSAVHINRAIYRQKTNEDLVKRWGTLCKELIESKDPFRRRVLAARVAALRDVMRERRL